MVHTVPTGHVETPPAAQPSMQSCPCDVCVHVCPDEQLVASVAPLLDDPHAAASTASTTPVNQDAFPGRIIGASCHAASRSDFSDRFEVFFDRSRGFEVSTAPGGYEPASSSQILPALPLRLRPSIFTGQNSPPRRASTKLT